MTPDHRESVYLAQTGRPALTPRQERRYAKKLHVPVDAGPGSGDPSAAPG